MPTLPTGQSVWIAYLNEIRRVVIVEKGARGQVFKRGMKPKDPYIVYDEIDEEEFVIASTELHHNPRDAQIAAAVLAKENGLPVISIAPLKQNDRDDVEEEDTEDDVEGDEEEEYDEEEEEYERGDDT